MSGHLIAVCGIKCDFVGLLPVGALRWRRVATTSADVVATPRQRILMHAIIGVAKVCEGWRNVIARISD